jgi:hypothetical protein
MPIKIKEFLILTIVSERVFLPGIISGSTEEPMACAIPESLNPRLRDNSNFAFCKELTLP